MLFVPPRIVTTRKCQRCRLHYPSKEKHCPHCSDLSDYEVERLKLRYKEESKGNALIGKIFIFVAILIVIGIVIL